MKEMTDEQRKRLTEFLGKEWKNESLCFWCNKTGDNGFHVHDGDDYDAGKHYFLAQYNRTFTTWDDFGALWERLISVKQINAFLCHVSEVWVLDKKARKHDFTVWLINPTRFALLVVEALEKEVIK